MATAELLIIAPEDPTFARVLVSRMLQLGIFFHFDDPYRLPQSVPPDLSHYKLVILPAEKAGGAEAHLDAFEEAGGRVLALEPKHWTGENFIERIPLLGSLTPNNPAMAARMEAISDETFLDACAGATLRYRQDHWDDRLRYHIETLFDHAMLTGDASVLAEVGRLVEKSVAALPAEPENTDHLACLYAILGYAEKAKRGDLIDLCRRVADTYLERAPRFRGVIANFLDPREAGILRGEIGFSVSSPLARLAHLTGEHHYADIAVEQLLLLDRELTDAATGLWFLGRTDTYRTPVLWSRGCAFSLRGVLETLVELPADHTARRELAAIIKRICVGFASLQTDDGQWRQVLDEPHSRTEQSAACWIIWAMAKALRLGIIGDDLIRCIERGWRAIKRNTWDGQPLTVAYAITASIDPDYYRYRTFATPSLDYSRNNPFLPLSAAVEMARFRKCREVTR